MNTHPETPKPPCPVGASLYASLLPQLRAGTLAPREQEALRRHLRFCTTCRDEATAAADQVTEQGVRRQYGIPSDAPLFLTLDAIRERATRNISDTTTDTDEINRHLNGLNHHRGKSMTIDEQQPQSSTAGDWPRQPIKPPNHWRTAAAITSAVAIIALFALLLRGFAEGKGAPSLAGNSTPKSATVIVSHTTPPANNTHGQWHIIESMAYSTTMFTQPLYPTFVDADPSIVYETSLSPVAARHSDDGGATWKAVNLPPGSDKAIDIEIFASPLDAHTAFLTVTVNLGYGQGANACPSASRTAYVTHGNIQASGQLPCSTTYRTTDEGKTWKAISFPVNGTIATPLSDAAPRVGRPIQAQGARLYALLNCGPTCISPGARLVSSADGGATWHAADGGGLGSGVCDYAVQPETQTVFAAISNGSCDAINTPALSLYRSDNGGGSWSAVGSLPNGAMSQGMAALTVNGKLTLVMNLPIVSWQPHIIGVAQAADEFRVSSDGGHTWTTSPLSGAPNKARPVIAPLIVRADGSLVVAFTNDAYSVGKTKLYTWKPGEASWKVFAPAPPGQVSTLLRTVSSTGEETFWAIVVDSSAINTNSQVTTFAVARYQP
jgi:hypothetical protein